MKMHCGLRIRELDKEDAEQLLAFYHSNSAETRRLFDPFREYTLPTICEHLRGVEGGRHVSLGVVRVDGTIEGHGFVLRTDSDTPVFGIGLNECIQNAGWGYRLMRDVLAESDRRSVPVVTLTYVVGNDRARALYEKMGFVHGGPGAAGLPPDRTAMARVLEHPADHVAGCSDEP